MTEQKREHVRAHQRPGELQHPVPGEVRPGQLMQEGHGDREVGQEMEGVLLLVGQAAPCDADRSGGHGEEQKIAAKLDSRPGETLNWLTPSEKLDDSMR